MRRICICVFLIWGPLALLTPPPPAAAVAADTTAAPARRDTVQAGGWKITGEVEKQGEGTGISDVERKEIKEELQTIGRREVGGGLRQWQRRKVPKVAWLSSVVLPGLGQVYNGRRIKVALAVGFFTVYAASSWLHWKDAQALTAYRDNLPEDTSGNVISNLDQLIEFEKETSRDFLWWSVAIWVIIQLDAWIDAHLYDLRVYTPSATPSEPQANQRVERRQYLTLSIEF